MRSLSTITLLMLVLAPSVSRADGAIIVTTWEELDAALVEPHAGPTTIRLRAGEYLVTHALVVPAGVTLVGEGEMLTDADGLPTGFAPGTETTLRASGTFAGDLVTLLDGTKLRGLQIVDTSPPRPTSNPLAIVSQHAFDSISADVVECEIRNYGTSGIGPNGPIGRAVVILNRTIQTSTPMVMHEGSSIDVRIARSLIHSYNNGSGVFAINFAARSHINLDLSHNYVGGGLDANGGVSRPLEVSDSTTDIRSHHNLYRSDSQAGVPASLGWQIQGGSGPPPNTVIPPTHDNATSIDSSHDRIEGFVTAIAGAAGHRYQSVAGPSDNNRLTIDLNNARLSSLTADFRLAGAECNIAGLAPGDNNVTVFRARNVVGSGPRTNYFGNGRLTLPNSLPTHLDPSFAGTGNRLDIDGTAAGWDRKNSGIEPGPAASFFTGD